MKTKKFLLGSFSAVLLASTFIVPAGVAMASYNETYIVSAYYSPLPCQDRYVTGSFEGDKRLNGNGTNGADGTPVYPGMVAAPKTYAFGTKLFIPGVGTVAVHDRGGAIVDADTGTVAHDRLDIWMGYGDVGLKRALNWGRRTVDVTVYGVDPSIKEEIYLEAFTPDESVPKCSNSKVEAAAFVKEEAAAVKTVESSVQIPVQKVEEVKPVEKPAVEVKSSDEVAGVFDSDLKPGDIHGDVRRLQEELKRLNYLKVDSTAIYGDLTAHAVFKFQQSQGLVGSKADLGAGVFGPKTRSRLNNILAQREATNRLIAAKTDKTEKVILANADMAIGGPDVESKYTFGDISGELDFGDSGEEVRKLQLFLLEEGYFAQNQATAFYGEVTRDAVVKYQMDHGIVASLNDLGAGRVGPATLKKINSVI